MELSINEQRRLTEWLGECNHFFRGGSCQLCGASFSRKNILDFNDWKVIGQLIEKVEQIEVWKSDDKRYLGLWGGFHNTLDENIYEATPQLAICRTVLRYLCHP